MVNMYDPDIDEELNGDFGMQEYDDNRDNDNKEHTSRAKGRTNKRLIRTNHTP